MASRFWVGGTGTWDASDTTHWAATSGGAGGQSVPGAADTVTIDASSGAGTITVNTTVTTGTITCGAMGMTLDFSANNNNVNCSGVFSATGTGTRTINMGNGTWTFSATIGTLIDFGTVTNLTFNANSSTIVYSALAPVNSRAISTGGRTFNNFTVNQPTSAGFAVTISGTNPTFNTVTLNPKTHLSAASCTISTLSASGTSGNQILITGGPGTVATLTVTTATITWAALNNITFATAAPTATNSFDLGGNNMNGGSITPPSGSGVVGVIGG